MSDKRELKPKFPEKRKWDKDHPRDYVQYDRGYNHGRQDCIDSFNEWESTEKEAQALRCPKCDGAEIKPDDLTAEEIHNVLKEYAESFGYVKSHPEAQATDIDKALDAIISDRYESTVEEAYKAMIADIQKLREYLRGKPQPKCSCDPTHVENVIKVNPNCIVHGKPQPAEESAEKIAGIIFQECNKPNMSECLNTARILLKTYSIRERKGE